MTVDFWVSGRPVRPAAGVFFEETRLEAWAELAVLDDDRDDPPVRVVVGIDLPDWAADALVLVWPGVTVADRRASAARLLGDLRARR